MLITSFIFLILAVLGLVGVVGLLNDREQTGAAVVGLITVVLFGIHIWFQTHTVVPTQYVGISRNLITQELGAPQHSGIASKPYLGTMHLFPAAGAGEYQTKYIASLDGSYGVWLDLYLYIDYANIDWRKEIELTGQLGANEIVTTWRNSLSVRVANTVNNMTPETLSEQRAVVESAIYNTMNEWFRERGITLVRVSFDDWDFTSEAVAAAFDESIVSQRKITEQIALLEAAKASRERELYEVETAMLVAQQQAEVFETLGLTGDQIVSYAWIQYFKDENVTPNVFTVGTTPIAVTP